MPDENERHPETHPTDQPAIDQLEAHLRELGAETETERAVKRILPWVTSIAFHAAFIFLGFVIVFTIRLAQEEDPVVIRAEFDDLTYRPLAQLNPNQQAQDETTQNAEPVENLTQRLDEQLRDLDVDPLSLLSDASSRQELSRFAPEPKQGTAKFAGLTGTNARRIAYVVDASGSMITAFNIVVEELARSIDQLSPRQSFAIVFFQANEAIVVPPKGAMTQADRQATVRALEWIEQHVIPKDRSNPLAAIEYALRLDPDVVFMLSENITGSGQYALDQEDLLATLDEMNPVDPETGRRQVQIKCIQFLYPDPLGTLQKIGETHGGEDGYKFLDAQELGIGVR